MKKKYDVVIIGSGMSGLTCASLITQLYQKNVLVIEQHSKIGGYAQTYHGKNGHSWEVGIHQVGELSKASMLNRTFDFITHGKILWRKMPEKFIKFYYPDFTYEIYSSKEKQVEYLCNIFPDEKDCINKYFDDIEKVAKWYIEYNGSFNNEEKLKKLLDKDVAKIAFLTLEEYLLNLTNNAKLRSLFASQWPDYGLPPSLSAFIVHALLVTHLINGVYFPEQGAQKIIDVLEAIIKDNGGSFLTNSKVEKVNFDGEKAVSIGVRSQKDENEYYEIEGDYFISTIGAINTYFNLLHEVIPQEKLQRMQKWLKYGTSHVNLFASLNTDPKEFGIEGELAWIFDSYDHNQIYHNRFSFKEEKISHCTFSFPSTKKTTNGKHTMIINSLIDYSVFEKWKGLKNKSDDYQNLKKDIGLALIKMVENKIPGISNAIESWELSTPLTTERITQHYNGFIYGLPSIPDRYRDYSINVHTPVSNFFMSGVDTTGFGIYGAISSGLLTVPAVFSDKEFFINIIKRSREFEQI